MSTKEKIIFLLNHIKQDDLETLYKVVVKFAFPAEKIPNDDTIEAFAEAEDMEKHPENYKIYTSVENLFEDLNAED